MGCVDIGRETDGIKDENWHWSKTKENTETWGGKLIDVDYIQLVSLLEPMNVKKTKNEETQYV